jgi:hypothetical protein
MDNVQKINNCTLINVVNYYYYYYYYYYFYYYVALFIIWFVCFSFSLLVLTLCLALGSQICT